jgi:hypothetical protein
VSKVLVDGDVSQGGVALKAVTPGAREQRVVKTGAASVVWNWQMAAASG